MYYSSSSRYPYEQITDRLPPETLYVNLISFPIGATGFEPATSRPPAVRATKLRHTPVMIIIPDFPQNAKHFFYFF
jgi:hypothetical protein